MMNSLLQETSISCNKTGDPYLQQWLILLEKWPLEFHYFSISNSFTGHSLVGGWRW